MRTTTKLVAILAVAVGPVIAAAGPARAGGGCEGGATQASGTSIRIVHACFTSTILHVRPGDTVTWVNDDPFFHNITANGWGQFDDLKPLARYAATFEQTGLYPFACTLHPGMSGVIVVGSGDGPGNGTTVEVAAPVDPAALAPVVSADPPSGPNRWLPTVLGVALGLIAGWRLRSIRRGRTAT
jgi:plastocyanin